MSRTELILFYDAPGSGNAYLHPVTSEGRDRRLDGVAIPLGIHSTLCDAIGEARRLGYKPEGWTSVDSNLAWIMDVHQIRTKFDESVIP